MKTTNGILGDFWIIVSDYFDGLISGSIYRKTRLTDSNLEDVVINIIPGIVGKFVQDGALILKVFYLDILQENTYFEDSKRGYELEELLLSFSNSLVSVKGYSFYLESREIYTESVDEIHQHYAVLRINFKLV